MTYKPGTKAPETAIYWCSVCKAPAKYQAGADLPECRNMCGKGRWELVKKIEEQK